MPAPRRILVTAALPYANNALHIGHMVEYVQTDIWVRFQRSRGHEVWFCCASDAHGTPTMLKAEEENTTPEALLDRVYLEHRRDFDTFGISVDNYKTTHAPENRELTEELYRRLSSAGHIARRTIKQAYDIQRGMFLPDRYVRGTCPRCSAPDQYGDSCEVCGAAYSPLDLKDAVSTVSGTAPAIRESEHLFLRLAPFETELRAWVDANLDSGLARKLAEWFEVGLQDWDISRDAPYFGFAIPAESDKYFYVWFDALIGYMSSFLSFCRTQNLSFDEFWSPESAAELYHFIGKDIVYFHAIYWPAMLSGAGYRKPSSVVTHGFLTINGQKMSKRRGTFIFAQDFAKHVDPEYLRYYFASKLGPTPEDIDLSLADFVAKVNSDLVGKYVNIASRCAGFIHKLNDGRLGGELPARELYDSFVAEGEAIAADFEACNYARAVRRIMALADRANRYIDDHKPWQMARDSESREAVVDICTQGINLFRVLSIYLKPLVPLLVERVESFLGSGELTWQQIDSPLTGCRIEKFKALLNRLDLSDVENMAVQAGQPPDTRSGRTEADAQDHDQPTIDIGQFAQIDLRVARITAARHVDGADKLLEIRLDAGGAERTVFSGIRKSYDPEQLVGRHVVL
ncbi:MAG TPA: methionine--tRNA ligase, partial [Gammaproteobacteria bacterium]|nr:methionine--tRNA ligase [Gammaproteobacteria bacterium]